MKSYVLRLLKAARRPGSCRYCRRRVLWANCAPRGRAVALVTTPLRILREEHTDSGLVFEVVASDQRHECPETPKTPRKASRMSLGQVTPPAWVPRRRCGETPFESFTPERLQQLRAALSTGHQRETRA